MKKTGQPLRPRGASACCFALAILPLLAPAAGAQSCDLLQPIGDGETSLLSYDGRIAVKLVGSTLSAFRISDGGNSVPLQSLGYVSNLNDLSRDGEFIVGTSRSQVSGSPERACRWSADGSLQDLGTLGGTEALALACSADGSVVVGRARNASEEWRAFRWDSVGGMQPLSVVGTTTGAADISADGTVIVGTSSNGSFPNTMSEMFRWTSAGGTQYLGMFQGDNTEAHLVSADGSAIAGIVRNNPGKKVLRWTAATGYQQFGSFTTAVIHLAGISADGKVLGYSLLDFSSESYIWREANGLQYIGPTGDDFLATISSDGTVGVGSSVSTSPTERFATVWDFDTGGFPPTSESFRASGGQDTWLTAISGDGSMAGGRFSSATFMNTAFVIPLALGIADRYCTSAVANSTGCPANVSAHGSGSASITDLRLSAASLPPGAAGYFLTSTVQASVFPIPGSQGRLCLGGSIGRISGPGQVFSAGASGRATVTLTSGTLPTPVGPATVLAGDTWNFQAWYRDANPGATSNFTDAVSVTFH